MSPLRTKERLAQRSPARRRTERGFTILEVLISVVIVAVGILAGLGLQSTAIRNKRTAHDVLRATSLAETVLARMQRESIMWNSAQPTTEFASEVDGTTPRMPLLRDGLSTSYNTWIPLDDGAPYNQYGLPHDTTMGNLSESPAYARTGGFYCPQYRIVWVNGAQNELARAQVRIVWPRTREGEVEHLVNGECPTATGDMQAMVDDTGNTLSVVVNGVLSRHVPNSEE